MTGSRFRLHGLEIDSEIDLHAGRPRASAAADLQVRWGSTVPATTDVPAGRLLAQWSIDSGLTASFVTRPDESHLLRFEATCDVVVDRAARTVTVHMVEGVPPAMGGVLVGGTVLSWVLMLRGELVLHASAVDAGGRALAFVGASGMGKTTLATLMCRDGGLLVTDDVLRVRRTASGVATCALGATELRLRAAAAGLADGFAGTGSHRDTADDRRALSVPVATEEDTPLMALVVPRPRRDSAELGLTRLPPTSAALALLAFPRILGVSDPGLLAAQFVLVTELAEAVPVLVADVPWGPPFRAGLGDELLAALETELDEAPSASARTDHHAGTRS